MCGDDERRNDPFKTADMTPKKERNMASHVEENKRNRLPINIFFSCFNKWMHEGRIHKRFALKQATIYEMNATRFVLN